MTRKKAQRAMGEAAPGGEQGFMLLGLIVAIGIILLVLGVAASEAAFSIRREREVESARRANQYVRAIRRYYLKNSHYPGSIDVLDKGVGLRYLRQRYVDPLTRKADYRLILVNQNKTIPRAFFGEPLSGIPAGGLGALAANQSQGMGPAPGIASPSGAATPTDTSGGSSLASQFGGAGLSGTVGPFMGVGSSASGPSILVVNEQTTYETWEFLYDPRVEKLKAAAALNAGVGTGQLPATPGAPPDVTKPTNTTDTPPNGGAPQPQP